MMNKWITRIRAVAGMGILWAIGWAVIGGAVMEGILDRHGAILDMWPQTLAIAGFLGGAVFATVLGIVASRRRFDELSIFRFGVWGALAGLIVGGLLVATGAGALIIVPLTVLCAGSASGSLALARKARE
jgi:hypothetical protein